MAGVFRWTLVDASAATPNTYTFEVNPHDMDVPGINKTLTYNNTAGPNGNVLAYEGRDQVRTGTLKGDILTQTQYNNLYTWCSKRRQLILTDDIGRSYTIYITAFKPVRVRVASNPWKHTYEIDMFILDWT